MVQNRLVAVHADGTPLRPECYTDEFQRLHMRAGLRRIKLHGLRNTRVSLMLDQGHPPHTARPGTATTRRWRCRSTPT